MFTWDPCAVNPGTFNRVSKMAYELRIVLLSAFIACMLWLLRQRRLRQRRMLEIQRLRSAIERKREVHRLGRQRRRRIRMSHTVFVVSLPQLVNFVLVLFLQLFYLRVYLRWCAIKIPLLQLFSQLPPYRSLPIRA